ncbi:hypothetical protein EVAR_46211_1 [Eumeta japonica]|uniref:Uncharacterized protein n=1 Tax=Eumeta variegata TaxID=151549 RepID=A0A4C1WDQ7_EUMVA|nr:hypothetical protein EVAR_46211_1 [Eumeta japonica]
MRAALIAVVSDPLASDGRRSAACAAQTVWGGLLTCVASRSWAVGDVRSRVCSRIVDCHFMPGARHPPPARVSMRNGACLLLCWYCACVRH